jgi:hypothetical protein
MLGSVSIAAATAVVGYDLTRDQLWKQAGHPRRMVGLALCGSTAAGDTKVIVYVGTRRVAEVYNTAAGFPTRDHQKPMNEPIPAGTALAVIVDDAPVTNPINLEVTFIP